MSKSLTEIIQEKKALEAALLAQIQAFREANPDVLFEVAFTTIAQEMATGKIMETHAGVKITLWL